MTKRPRTKQHFTNVREGASIALFKGRSVLLVQRGQGPFAGLWSLPGGKAEGPETPRETACRELKEETGIEAAIDGVAGVVRVAAEEAGGEKIRHRLTVFYGRPTGGDLKIGSDASGARWVPLEKLKTLPLTPDTAELIWTAAHRLRDR